MKYMMNILKNEDIYSIKDYELKASADTILILSIPMII